MEKSKLMTPLFYEGNFNREGRRMRAVFEREITDGTTVYRLWRGTGKSKVYYPRSENDKYFLHVEINGYLIPLGITDYQLIANCGNHAAEEHLYGGKEGREQHFDHLRKSGGDDVLAAIEEENKEIAQYGSDPARQTAYIQRLLDDHVSTYLKSKEAGGQSFPDFYGALVLNDLARCQELSAVYKAKRQAERTARRVRAAEEEKAYCEERNRTAEQAVSAAIQVIREGGDLKNETITFYQSRYHSRSYSIVNYLMQQYRVDVPLRTQGWINEMLSSVTIRNGRCEHYRFFRSKRGKGSQRFFECMNSLLQAVRAATPEQTQEDAA